MHPFEQPSEVSDTFIFRAQELIEQHDATKLLARHRKSAEGETHYHVAAGFNASVLAQDYVVRVRVEVPGRACTELKTPNLQVVKALLDVFYACAVSAGKLKDQRAKQDLKAAASAAGLFAAVLVGAVLGIVVVIQTSRHLWSWLEPAADKPTPAAVKGAR